MWIQILPADPLDPTDIDLDPKFLDPRILIWLWIKTDLDPCVEYRSGSDPDPTRCYS